MNNLIKTVIIILLVVLVSCENKENESARLNIHLTDKPAEYEAVYIDIIGVEVHYSLADTLTMDTLKSEWIALDTYVGMYNLLELQNDVDTLIVSDNIPTGTLYEIRLLLSDQNYIVAEGDSLPLKVPSGQSSGLKVKVNQTIVDDAVLDLTIDFDAYASVVKTGNDKYILKPVLKVENINVK